MKKELKEFNLMIRFNDDTYSYIRDFAKKYDTTISNMTRILIFANYAYFDLFLSNKKNNSIDEEETTYKKRISIFLKKNEYDILKKISEVRKQKISTIIRSLVLMTKRYYIFELDEVIKFLMQLDNLNFDLSNTKLLKKLFKIYSDTNLSISKIFERLIENINEDKIIEIINKDSEKKDNNI